MPTKRMITRTIKANNVTVLCLNTETAEPFNTSVTTPAYIKTEEKIMKYVRKTVDTDTVKAVQIVSVEPMNTTLAMPEEDFIAMAKPYNRKNN